ncbi:hypothetical protein FH972_013381 [Carpinus fangiana]|uniref:Bet v I/Major latex protein domain-containing protein n=1 Tax=Carpinus fangiana TaxID=176857 RepID=A0A5N6RA13_9ROSI|nr:hypothetical protein FH972_013381 [Carpinus fangiana]
MPKQTKYGLSTRTSSTSTSGFLALPLATASTAPTEPGCIRYCAGFSIPSDGAGADKPFSWSKERLTAVDNEGCSLSYEIVDSNIGFKSYITTVKIVPQGADGCVIEWSFTVDPVEGWVLDDLVKKYEVVGLQCMAKRMEDAVLQHWDT